jgi:hypothetical protein
MTNSKKQQLVFNIHLILHYTAVSSLSLYIGEASPGIVLQNRAAHPKQSVVRQIARKPQPPIELRVVQFS